MLHFAEPAPAWQRFDEQEKELLLTVLRLRRISTYYEDFHELKQLLLYPSDLATAYGYRLSRSALSQVARRLSAGLDTLLTSLLKEAKPLGTALPIAVYNMVLEKYGGRLRGTALLLDRRARRIEALCDGQDRPIENSAFLSAIDKVTAEDGRSFAFGGAYLRGPQLILRLRMVDPLLQFGKATFYRGWYFANHEGGRRPPILVPSLVRSDNGLVFLEAADTYGTLTRTGRRKPRQLHELVRTTLGRWPDVRAFAALLARSQKQKLPENIESFYRRLRLYGLSPKRCRDVLLRVAASDKRGYDLLEALGQAASVAPPLLQRRLERLNYRLLLSPYVGS
jgi:hypothetical protein